MENEIGLKMYQLAKELFPICRSISGNGVRKTLSVLKREVPELEIHEVPSGTGVFDWTVPKEWNIRDAYVMDEDGNKVIDFKKSNLHVVGYSIPVNETMPLKALQKHLYSLPEQPDAIPYVTSYYQERWGFCISHQQRQQLKNGLYQVYIDSELKNGSLTYGELIVPGKTSKEIFLSTYVCHPSMANNELSGPVVVAALAKWILSKPMRYTYRIIFIPETIGSITYLSLHHDEMKKNIIAGFNVTCVGDERTYSFLPSRYGNTLADKAALHVLKNRHLKYKHYSYLDRGSDERQYCSPGIDLPVASIMRSKFGEYPEYHTSLDNLTFITAKGLASSYSILKDCLEALERNHVYQVQCCCEPQLSKRELYPTLSTKNSGKAVRNMMNFLAYADGNNDLLDIANIIHVPVWELYGIAERLTENGLLQKIRVE